MSTTWENVRLVQSKHQLDPADARLLLDLMRVDGVRRVNVRKNTGKMVYAFNGMTMQGLAHV